MNRYKKLAMKILLAMMGITGGVIFFCNILVVSPTYAWTTDQTAAGACNSGVAVINVHFTNTETANTNAMNVVATDNQTGIAQNLGTVTGQQSVTASIITNTTSIQNGTVVFSLAWTDGTSGTDSKMANYTALSCSGNGGSGGGTQTPIPSVRVSSPPATTTQNSISGTIYIDTNDDGKFTPGIDVPYTASSSMITLTDAQGKTMTTPVQNGKYSASNLAAGIYTISYSAPTAVYTVFYPKNPGNFTVSIGNTCKAAGNDATCDSGGNVTNLNFGLTYGEAWICQSCNPATTPGITTSPLVTNIPVASTTPKPSSTLAPSPSGSGFGWSVAYYTGWEQIDYPPSTLVWNAFTELIQFSLMSTNGSVNLAHSLTPALMQDAVSAAHAHNKKILISIGGAEDVDFLAACNTTNRNTFITGLVGIMKQYGYDGIDLDIEQDFSSDYPDYIACVSGIRSALDQITPRPMLTMAADPDWQAQMASQVAQYVDQINIMSYWSDVTKLQTELSNYTSVGIPKNKIGIGFGVVKSDNEVDWDVTNCTAKANFAASNTYGGVMIWTINDDQISNNGQTPCLNVIASHLGGQ